MSIRVPLRNYDNFIGRVGEAIVKKYLETNGFTIYAKEFEIPYIGARVDFLISKKDNKKDLFEKIVKYVSNSEFTSKPELIAEKYIGKEYTNMPYDKFSDFVQKVSEKHPDKSLTYLGDLESITFYDLMPLAADQYDLIQENFMIIEVKSSIGKYPRNIGKSGFTRSQIENRYYDSLLRVKIESNIEGGFKGTIHPEDLINLHAHPKNTL